MKRITKLPFPTQNATGQNQFSASICPVEQFHGDNLLSLLKVFNQVNECTPLPIARLEKRRVYNFVPFQTYIASLYISALITGF